MVYIPRHIVERLDSLSVYDVAEKLDIDIVRNRALCFLHDDHHPSMQFNRAIPRHIVERLDSLSVYDVAEKLDIDIVRNRALCFLHDDHHPSMQFNRARNLWKCYVCQVGGLGFISIYL